MRRTHRLAVPTAVIGAILLVAGAPAQSRTVGDPPAQTPVLRPVAQSQPPAHSDPHSHGRATSGDEIPPTTIRMTQANLKNGTSVPKFQADVGTVLAGAPDFITYNEVPLRQDVVLAPPPGYAIWRTPGQYTGETPVAWRTDRWTAVGEGTTMLSDQTGRLPGQHLDWGVRYANWVTLQDAYGRKVSVVSAHLTPVISITEGLQEVELTNLGNLVNALGSSGPVLLGGDLNMNYQTTEYLGTMFAQYNLVPSYDALAAKLATGDHHGATIDYVMVHQDPAAPTLAFADQFASELNSDHDAVTVDLTFSATPVAPPPYVLPRGHTSNNPAGTTTEKRAALQVLVDAIDHVPAGGAIHVTTRRLSSPYVIGAVDRALDRGVHVQAIFSGRALTPAMKVLVARLGEKQWWKSFALKCTGKCRKVTPPKSPTQLLISDVAGTPAVKITADQPITVGSTSVTTTVHVVAVKAVYDKAFRHFFKMAGRKL